MKNLIFWLASLVTLPILAQSNQTTDWKKLAIQDLKVPSEEFKNLKVIYDNQQASLAATPITKEVEYDSIIKGLRGTISHLDSLYAVRDNAIKFYLSKQVPQTTLDSIFPTLNYTPEHSDEVSSGKDKKVYIIYGDGQMIEQEEVFKNEKVKPIMESLFAENSEAYLGDFEVPAHRQKIQIFYKEPSHGFFSWLNFSWLKVDPPHKVDKYLYFESVKVSIREGGIYDIRVLLSNKENTQKYYFSNTVPISLLRYMIVAEKSYLVNQIERSYSIGEVTDVQYQDHYVRLSDVLLYINNTGNNYVPDDEEYCFPADKEQNRFNSPRLYKIRQDTNLQNIMELRTYTDFLGLFDENSPNGLAQIEGKADFYLVPFQIHSTFPMTIFKKLTPYVRFSKMDADQRNVEIMPNENIPGRFNVVKSLQLLEKAYLDMGAVIDVFGFTFTKEFPFSLNLYVPVRYKVASLNMSDPNTDETDDENESQVYNFKTVGVGAGLRLEAKRFNNFGFTHSVEWTRYNHINSIDVLINPSDFWVFRNESEIFYYPNKNKKQSVFLRLRSYLNLKDGEDSFFQLQFGYRFAIGLSKRN